jgi:diguanylate cyclase (GGDEF)-like protein
LIKILKRQLFKPANLLPVSLLLPLLIFFAYGTYVNSDIFIFVVGLLVFCIGIMLPFHLSIIHKQAQLIVLSQDYFERSNLLEAQIVKEQQSIVSLRKKIVDYGQLKEMTERLSRCFTRQATLDVLSAVVMRFFDRAEMVVITYLANTPRGELALAQAKKNGWDLNVKSKSGDLFDHWVVTMLKPLLVEDSQRDFRFDTDKLQTEDSRVIRSVLTAPLLSDGRLLGMLRVDTPTAYDYSTEDLRLLTAIADVGAVSIENAQFYERVKDLAIKDSLTGLYLRRHFQEQLIMEFKREVRRKAQMSLLMIDLDHFKQYNDTYGHTAGDKVLKVLGEILSNHFYAPGHWICRYGGEEFAVLLTDCLKSEAVKMAEEFCRSVAARPISLRRTQTQVTVSIGVATFPIDAGDKDELLQKADAALYAAKRAGRNQVCASW